MLEGPNSRGFLRRCWYNISGSHWTCISFDFYAGSERNAYNGQQALAVVK